MNIPEDLRYSAEHEWVRVEGELLRVGVTDYAQDSLGDVVFVELPDVGRSLASGESFGEVESTKSVSDLFAPVAGTVVEINSGLPDSPERINDDPYGQGWMVVIEPSDPNAIEGLLDAAGYRELIGE